MLTPYIIVLLLYLAVDGALSGKKRIVLYLNNIH